MTPQKALHLNTSINTEINRDTINIYNCRYDQIDKPELLDQYHSLLSQAEQQRWKGIRSEDGKRCFLVSRAMIRTLLGTANDSSPTELIITADAQGKPLINQPGTRWQFNLSHSHGLITLALAYDISVGVDVECHDRNTDTLQLARHFFHPREIQQLEALPSNKQRQHFFKLWTLKEAYVKAIGTGLSHGLDGFAFIFDQADSKLALHPSPQSVVSCWSAQPESGYTLASITLSQSPEARNMKLYDYLPCHHCSPKQLNSLIHSTISPNSTTSHCLSQ